MKKQFLTIVYSGLCEGTNSSPLSPIVWHSFLYTGHGEGTEKIGEISDTRSQRNIILEFPISTNDECVNNVNCVWHVSVNNEAEWYRFIDLSLVPSERR